MAYKKQNFVDNETVLTSKMMDHIETGIVENERKILQLENSIRTLESLERAEDWVL